MEKNGKKSYAGRIGTAGAQEIEALAPKKSGVKKATVRRGKDLREGK